MTDEVKSGKLKLVFDNDEKELARQRERTAADRAAVQLTYATRALAANILRIIAGAGKDYELVRQIVEVLNAYKDLHPLSGRASYPYAPSYPMVEGLRELDWRKGTEGYHQSTEGDLARRELDGTAALDDAKADVVQSALRLIAAQLMAQPTQESVADGQLVSAIRRYEESFEARNVRSNEERRRRSRSPQGGAAGTAHLGPSGNAASLRTRGNGLEQTLQTHEPCKRIGIYDALDEQNRKRRETAVPNPKQP